MKNDYFTCSVDLSLFDINSSKIRKFKTGTKFVLEKLETNYNDYYKTCTYHIRVFEKESNSVCIFTCSKQNSAKDVIVYNCMSNDSCPNWNFIFKENFPV